MSLMAELQEKMQYKNVDELIDVLSTPDEDLRFARLVDVSGKPEARLLETGYGGSPIVQAKVIRRLVAPIVLEAVGPARFLDDTRILKGVDSHGMLPRIPYFYSQMVQMSKSLEELAASKGAFPKANRILVFGVGGSAIGAILAREVIQNQGYCLPMDIHMSYPESFHGIGSDTLVVACSYSGDTQEVLHAVDYAEKRTDKILILSRGGQLGRLRNKYRFIEIPESGIQAPRESTGYWLTAFWFIMSSLGLARRDDGTVFRFDISDIEEIRPRLDEVDEACSAEVPFAENPAKQHATHFLYGTRSGESSLRTDWYRPREPVVFLDGADRALGKKLANEFGETVEHPITLLVFAEDAHNEIESVATLVLEDELRGGERRRTYALISSKPYESDEAHHRESPAARRMEATLEALLEEHMVDFLRIEAEGRSLLERKLCLLKHLDYARLYASILLGTSPLPTVFMDMMKSKAGEALEVPTTRQEAR